VLLKKLRQSQIQKDPLQKVNTFTHAHTHTHARTHTHAHTDTLTVVSDSMSIIITALHIATGLFYE